MTHKLHDTVARLEWGTYSQSENAHYASINFGPFDDKEHAEMFAQLLAEAVQEKLAANTIEGVTAERIQAQ